MRMKLYTAPTEVEVDLSPADLDKITIDRLYRLVKG